MKGNKKDVDQRKRKKIENLKGGPQDTTGGREGEREERLKDILPAQSAQQKTIATIKCKYVRAWREKQ